MREPGAVRRLSALGALYFAQGIVYGFGGYILVPSLAAAGVSLDEQAGIVALAAVPWVLKLAWAPVLDRGARARGGRARWFVVGAMLVVAAALVALASYDDLVAQPRAIAWLWLGVNVGLSLQDVATDALVLDRVPPAQRGLTNGVLLGSRHVGMEGLGGLALGLLLASRGLGAVLWAQASIMVVVAWAPLLLPRDIPSDARGAVVVEPGGSWRRQLWDVVWPRRDRAAVWAAAGIAAVVLSADVLTATVSAPLVVTHLGWSVEQVSTVLGPVMLVVNVASYAVVAPKVDRWGHARSAAGGCVALGGVWLGFGLCPGLWSSHGFFIGFVAVQGLATSMLYVGLHAALMDATMPAVRATHFTVLMALLNLPRVVVAPAAPRLLEALGYSGLFMVAGVVQMAMAGVVIRLRPWRGSGATTV